MKYFGKRAWLPLTAVGLGFGALCLRGALYAVAVDQKNLLIAGHPLELALWAVVFAGAAVIIAGVWKLDGSNVYEDNFSASRWAAVGSAMMAAGVLVTVLNQPSAATGTVTALWKILGFLSAPAMMWAGICRGKGQKPFFGIHGLLSLFLLIHVVSRYQVWSGNPQLQDYVFELLAAVALTLFSYHCAAFEADMGKRRMQLATGLLAVLLCGGALAGTEFTALYLSGAVWAAAELCSLEPLPKKAEEVEPHDPS